MVLAQGTKTYFSKVTGIGGIFFKSQSPEKLVEWYGQNLGIAMDANLGSPFEFRNANDPSEINYLRWNLFADSTDYFDPSKSNFMVNYRVQNIEGLVESLKEKGGNIVDDIAVFEYYLIVLQG